MKIIVPRRALLRFRTECRELWPKEHLACLWGERTHDTVSISQFAKFPYRHTADGNLTYDYYPDVQKSKMAALRAGLEWLGTIHSHPFTRHVACCEHLSETDIHFGVAHGETISGVCLVYKDGRRTSVHWFLPQIPPEVTYT